MGGRGAAMYLNKKNFHHSREPLKSFRLDVRKSINYVGGSGTYFLGVTDQELLGKKKKTLS